MFSFVNCSFLAALLSAVVGQNTLVRLNQWRLPLRNGSTEDTMTSSIGTLKHILTMRLRDTVANGSQFGGLSSIIVSQNGSEILTISDSGIFAAMNLSSTVGDEYNVTEAMIYPMRDPQGQIIPFDSDPGDAEGLTINGSYEGGGRGQLYVSYEKVHRVLEFPNGTESRASVNLNVSYLFSECPRRRGLEAILKQRPTAGIDGLLLMLCEDPSNSSAPTADPQGRIVLPGWAYNETSNDTKRFYVESNRSFNPTDMAELNGGDMMILFRRFVPSEGNAMRIGYVTKVELDQAMAVGGTLNPQIIAEVWTRDG
ncbi:hypothetical protein FOZ62_030983 [Perkinsus olseni]|uniref:Phytase-like domain-containing protein n=2 Tax=Perkinsus olseni TaxID=32597 RepID=A0A7J6QIR7_PEROL|nr:hypothetical protein FOZ62_030983 [Perkinsus olseni]